MSSVWRRAIGAAVGAAIAAGLMGGSMAASVSDARAAGEAQNTSGKSSVAGGKRTRTTTDKEDLPEQFLVNQDYVSKLRYKVFGIVSNQFYSANIAKDVWQNAFQNNAKEMLASTNLKDLSDSINGAIHELKSSHCQFVTTNDETFYFLHSLFSSFNPKLAVGKMDYTGVITGGVKSKFNQVRYVIDGSPGEVAGLKRGDLIVSVDGKPYVGQANFWGKAGKALVVRIKRGSELMTEWLIPKAEHDYKGYCDGIGKSVRIFDTPKGKIGYVHLWAGGGPSHDVFETFLRTQLIHTDGLILDFRDGYGGNSMDDLDYFYRPKQAYPTFEQTDRSGKKSVDQEYYDKPVVALINGGSRSGKELLSYSFKMTGRAKLIGENTAGAVLAGKLIPIDNRTALYLAVGDVKVNGERLEGKGVAPDIEVPDDASSSEGYEHQFAVAKSTLLEMMGKPDSASK